jgi:LysM repeat protein
VAPREQTETSLQPGVKLAAAAVVIFGGVGVALLFRHDPSEGQPTAPSAAEQLLLHPRGGPAASPALPWPGGSPSVGAEPSGPRPTVLKPQTQETQPPTPGHDLSGRADQSTSSWGTSRGMSMEMLLPRHDPPAAPRTHTIVDGDSLPALAQRYLGSAERYMELFEANRNVLTSPGVLPIGTRLAIPPTSAPRERRADPDTFWPQDQPTAGGFSG